MMILYINLLCRGFILAPAICIFVISKVSAEAPDTALKKISERDKIFVKAAKYFDINVEYLKAIVYVERTLNYDWLDLALDDVLAYSGQNSSIGFCQVKIKTAYWIEYHLNDKSSEFFLGDEYSSIFFRSVKPVELINKLNCDSINIYYAAAYLKIIQERWIKKGFPIDERPDIIGTLYSTGLFFPNGRERKPHKYPESNFFGFKVMNALNMKLFK